MRTTPKSAPATCPRTMAGLRNLAIGIFRQNGHTSIAAARLQKSP
ncbi:hypothetical protein [Streptomyces sp. NPDC048659]